MKTDGYESFDSGLIYQWGSGIHADDGGTEAISFPIPFPSRCLNVVVSSQAAGLPTAFHGVSDLAVGGVNVHSAIVCGDPGTPAPAGTAFHWRAIGC
jgi:hypothetical protein